MAITKISLQEYADQSVAETYRQPLKTLHEVLAINGWPIEDRPLCCGKEVSIRSFIGDAYYAECSVCRKFILDVRGPSFGNAWVNVIDSERVECETDAAWIAGISPSTEEAS